MVYLELFHGRRKKTQQMDDWGSMGPVLGPFRFIQTTYGSHLKCGIPETHGPQKKCTGHFPFADEIVDVFLDDDMVYYGGVWYGDWSVFSSSMFATEKDLQRRHQHFRQSKANLPRHRTPNRKRS
jgi:hypothetical protein